MRAVAMLTVRNENRFLARCLEHLCSQEIETCVIDNGSTDRTMAIAEQFLGRGVFRIERLPFPGHFDIAGALANNVKVAREIPAEWFLHVDADEILQAPKPFRTLLGGIKAADEQGYNAIHFDEFVFLPTDESESFEGKDYVAERRHYYFFEPWKLRQIRALTAECVRRAVIRPHRLEIAGMEMKVFPTPFIMRHYIALSKAHAIEKYAGRIYSRDDILKGYHLDRAGFSPKKLIFPAPSRLKTLNAAEDNWDKSDPWTRHSFLWGDAPPDGPVPPPYPQVDPVRKDASARAVSPAVASLPPIPFVVGVPRSGTTLLRLLLDAHPELCIPTETHFVVDALKLREQGNALRDALYRTVTQHPAWPDFNLSSQTFFERLAAIDLFTVADGLRCFYELYAARFGKRRWGDKTPLYGLHILEIQEALPSAHFIHIIRDGRDVALSLKDLWFGPGKNIQEQAAYWLWCIRETRQQAQFSRHYMEVQYERLVLNTEEVLRDICAFVDMPYSPEMLNYHAKSFERFEFSGRYALDGRATISKEMILPLCAFFQQPPEKSRVSRWRRDMSDEDRARYEAVAGAMLRDLGYKTGMLGTDTAASAGAGKSLMAADALTREQMLRKLAEKQLTLVAANRADIIAERNEAQKREAQARESLASSEQQLHALKQEKETLATRLSEIERQLLATRQRPFYALWRAIKSKRRGNP